MNESVEFRGEYDVLVEFSKTLETAGVASEVRTLSLNSGGGGGYDFLQAAGTIPAILLALQIYLKSRRGSISVAIDGKQINVDGKDTEATKEMLRFAVVQLRKLDSDKGAK